MMIRTTLALALTLFSTVVSSHDIYSNLHEGMSPAGRLCCGGDPNTGDCEAVYSNYRILPNGDAVILTKRYGGQSVLIAKNRIQWFAVPGGEESEVHWCGKPRANTTYPQDAENIDPVFHTYCIFIRPGGV